LHACDAHIHRIGTASLVRGIPDPAVTGQCHYQCDQDKQVGIEHVGIGMDYMLGQAGTISTEDAMALYKYLVDTGDWSPKTYPPPPWHYLEGIDLPDTLYNLTGALLARGYKQEDIAKIWGGNWLRIMSEVWG